MAESGAAIEALLLALANAASTRSLYPAAHPQTEGAVGKVARTLDAVFEDPRRDHLSLLLVDDELAVDGKPWKRTSATSSGLVRSLARAGVESVQIVNGVRIEELEALVGALAGSSPAEASRHVLLGRVTRVESSAGEVADAGSIEQSLDAAYEALIELQDDLRRGFASLQRTVWGLLDAMARDDRSFVLLASLKKHDNRLWRHGLNTCLYATSLARALGLEGATLHDLALGSVLHDVGYLAYPDTVAIADLPAAERRDHPRRGAALLAGVEGVPTLPVLVAYEHHMGWSGTGGYPATSKPPNLASQITAVADTWDTLLQARGPLVHGARTERAARTLDRLAGELLHPDLVHVFLELVGLSDLGRGDVGSQRPPQERRP